MRGLVLFPGSAALDLPDQTPSACRWLERRGWVYSLGLDQWRKEADRAVSGPFVAFTVADYGLLAFTRAIKIYEETGKDRWTRQDMETLSGKQRRLAQEP